MKKILIVSLLLVTGHLLLVTSANAACSRSALGQCLDSVCAANITMNPAARCQLCGTATAGAAPAGLRGVLSANRNALTAAEIAAAPSDPGAKYAWATEQCIKKIPDCSAADVSAAYDNLIEQSCRAAGIAGDMTSILATARRAKTGPQCETDINSCIIAANRCGADMTACADNAVFDRNFAECVVAATGCDVYVADLRTKLRGDRDAAVRGRDTLLANVVAAHERARTARFVAANDGCKNNVAADACVATVCENNMKNKCAPGFESEKSMAKLLCGFHNTACDRLK